MKKSFRFLSSLLSPLLIFSSAACVGETNSASAVEPSSKNSGPTDLFLSLTEKTSSSLTFPLTEEQVAAVEKAGVDQITWTLHRTAPYGNPADGNFISLHDEEKMYPNEQETIDFASLRYGDLYETEQAFSMEHFETTLDGSTLKLDFATVPVQSLGNDGMPHESGGRFMDICGQFSLTAELDGVILASIENVIIKPYASFHSMWEMYDEIHRLAEEGDDDIDTPKPYVEYNVMGKSYLGYDMPYLIIARDSKSIQKWLELSEKAEENGTAVMDELMRSGDDDYQVPILYTNIHANEVAAADAVLEYARLLIEEPVIEYTKLTGFTEEGWSKVEEQRKELNLHTPELIRDKCNYLGSIWSGFSMDSAKVDGFDRYYTSEKISVNVADLLDDVFFIIVPEQNVDARMYYTRCSASGYNLNRDNSFQVTPETQNMQHLIGMYDPVTLMEIHGQVNSFQLEPSVPPHQPNFEYDILARHQMAGAEAFGAAAIGNNPAYQSFVILMRDTMFNDENGTPSWLIDGNDLPVIFTPSFAALHGCVGYTVELPAYSETTREAATFGLLGLADFVAANKESYFAGLAEIYSRGIENRNTDADVAPWFADNHDDTGAEAEIFRPSHAGEGENGQFFPECYLIPLDAEHQTNLQAAFEMIEYLTRNDVKVCIADSPVTVDGSVLPAGTAVVSMYQAKRSVANAVLYDGTFISTWEHLSNSPVNAFSHTRGFDMITCVKPAEYIMIKDALGETVTYDTLSSFLKENAVSQFSGEEGYDVIISNASESSTAAVNSLLASGKQVGMITEGAYKGDFICSWDDWKSVSDDYILTGTGIKDTKVSAYVIGKTPAVYISGTRQALTQAPAGYVYNDLVSFSSDYNYDRTALNLMGFTITEDAAKADAVVGGSGLDEEGLAAVEKGAPYVGYGENATEAVKEFLLPDVGTDYVDGTDCLGYVIYPEETLTNASYILDKDDVFYGSGTSYFTALPEDAKVLVQRDGSRAVLGGILDGDEAGINAFLNGIMGFSYAGTDKDGHDVKITLFANSMTEMGHQRDEYAFISNALFSAFLSETPYVTAAASGD